MVIMCRCRVIVMGDILLGAFTRKELLLGVVRGGSTMSIGSRTKQFDADAIKHGETTQ